MEENRNGEKNSVDVVIGGKVFTLTGDEEQSYLQKVAAYINGRTQELQKQAGFAKQKPDMQNILLQLNIADDYFKASKELETLKRKVHDQEKEIYRLKHELVSLKLTIDSKE